MKHKMIYVQGVDTNFYVSDKYCMQRNHAMIRWELKDLLTSELIDSDQFRNRIAERNALDLYAFEVDLLEESEA